MCKIQFDSDVKAMKIKLNGSGCFPHGHNLLLVYYRFEYKGNFYKCGLYYTWGQMLLQKGPLLRLVSKSYYGWDFYYAACMDQNVMSNETFITLGSSYYTCAFHTGKIGSLEMEMSQWWQSFFYARDDTVNVVLKKGAYGLWFHLMSSEHFDLISVVCKSVYHENVFLFQILC